jgi:WD40 repeat protein/predicted Ser/Thr protein kinase
VSYCINPKCPNPGDPANGNLLSCRHCGCDLVLQGRYRLIRPLGGGGFGKTFEADDRGASKVIKVLLQNNEKAVELFIQEADVLKRVKHPGIPAVEPDAYFTFTPPEASEPMHCLVMEKIHGVNLRDWMKQRGNRPVSQKQAIEWMIQLAEILEQVHKEQFFHRDIKPLNIMVKPNGQLVLIDFGAAREVTATYFAKVGQGQNITGIVSPGYTPPEQANGKAVPQSDFYALGRTFVFLLTGKPPTAFSEHPRTGKLVWRNSAPQIAKEFADVIDYLMAPFPGKRPQNSQAIVQCLAEIDLTLPGEEDTGKFNQKTMFGGRTAFSSNSSLNSRGSNSSGGKSPRLLLPKDNRYRTARSASAAKSRWQLSIALLCLILGLSQVYGYWRYGFLPANPIRLILSLPSSFYLKKTLRGVGQVQTIAMSPLKGAADFPEGATFASGSYGTIRIWNLRTGTLLHTIAAHKLWINALALTPDGNILASGSSDRSIRLWDFERGSRILTIAPAHSGAVQALAISPDGRLLASGSEDNTIRIWDLYSGARILTIQVGSGVNALSFSPDGKTLASGSKDRNIRIWHVPTGARLRTLSAHAHEVLSLAYSPDGKILASGSGDNTVQIWNLQTGERKYQLNAHASWVRSVAIAPDGQALATSGDAIKIWNLNTGELTATLRGHGKYVSAIAVSADGKTLVSGSPDETIKVWSMPEIDDSDG